MAPLDSVRWKLWRAQQHVAAVHDTAHAFLKSDFYTFGTEQDRKGRLVLKVVEAQPMPPVLSVLIGDAAHNLRSALDHLMFLLARPRTEAQQRYVQFPLVDRRRKFAGTKGNMPGVARGVRTAVEQLQPYHRRKWPETALLGHIAVIDNWDKHRTLTTTATALEGSRLNLMISGNTSLQRQESFRGRVKPGAIVARFEMGYSEVGAEVQVNPELTLMPVFGDGMPKQIRGLPVISTLGNAGMFIENEVVPRFERFL